MKIYYPENLFDILENKHLLLDTNVFIDSFAIDRTAEFVQFFNKLKANNTTLITIEGVCFEFLKGSKNDTVYNKKNAHIDDIIDAKLPSFRENSSIITDLIKLYSSDGGNVEIIDYLLGANLIKYKKNLFLMTRNIADFPQHIFPLKSTVSFGSGKTIFTYGIYTFETNSSKSQEKVDDVPF